MKADPGTSDASTLQSRYHSSRMDTVLAELKSQKQGLVPCHFSATGSNVSDILEIGFRAEQGHKQLTLHVPWSLSYHSSSDSQTYNLFMKYT